MNKSDIRAARPDTGPFVDLFNDPKDYHQVFDSIEHTIWWSFAFIDAQLESAAPTITQDKIRERFAICEKWFRVMRGDLGFGLIRTLDTIPRALACELLDVPFDPHAENTAQGWSRRPATIEHLLKNAKSTGQ